MDLRPHEIGNRCKLTFFFGSMVWRWRTVCMYVLVLDIGSSFGKYVRIILIFWRREPCYIQSKAGRTDGRLCLIDSPVRDRSIIHSTPLRWLRCIDCSVSRHILIGSLASCKCPLTIPFGLPRLPILNKLSGMQKEKSANFCCSEVGILGYCKLALQDLGDIEQH